MTRVERLRLAASLCLVGGSIDAAVLAGWAWPRVLAERSRLDGSEPAAVVAMVDVKRPPPGGATSASAGSPVAAPAAPPPSAPSAPTEAPGLGAPPAPAEPEPEAANQRAGSGAPPPIAPAPENRSANGSANGSNTAPIGIILFRTRTGKRWSDPNKAFARIVELAKDDPNLVLQVDGYADSHADHHDNRRLSLRRARRVAMLLQTAGCSPHQIIVRGHGEHRARATGHGRGARRWNRRVEIHVHGRGAS